jgi:hypothetical protein
MRAEHAREGYTGHDYPRSWPIGPLSRSYMPLEDSVHYNLQSEIGRTEWATLLPNNNSGTIYLGSSRRPFSISLFHHLRCLDILRVELDVELDHLGEDPPDRDEQDRLIGHCMGYIRQMILCHSDTRLESVRAISGASISYSDVTHTCRDWTAVFRAADENSRAQFS